MAIDESLAEEIFLRAEQHWRAIKILSKRQLKANKESRNPIYILEAFALELYFKSLIALETGNQTMGHALDELFEQLNGATQTGIQKQFEYELGGLGYLVIKDEFARRELNHLFVEDIKSALKQSSEAFQVFRYI